VFPVVLGPVLARPRASRQEGLCGSSEAAKVLCPGDGEVTPFKL